MRLGCIADDFTGASDLANTLAQGGMAVTLFVGTPDIPAGAECEAGVVALKSRSIPAADAVKLSLAALDWLRRQGCEQIVFKYCSTFDSTPAGNIGPVAEALQDALNAPVAIVCPAFPAAGRLLFQGHLFVNGRPLHESGMERHPLTPMTDPDIRRWLAQQTTRAVGHVPLAVVARGAAALRQALAEQAVLGCRLVVVDAIAEADLLTIGAAVADHALVTGGSGVALGLPANFQAAGHTAPQPFVGLSGPGLVLSGSCSAASVRQIAVYAAQHPSRAIEPDAILAGAITPESAWAWAAGCLADSPALYSTADPGAVAAAQQRWGAGAVAAAIETFFGAVAVLAVAGGVQRLVVGGGETSGAVVSALGLRSFVIGPEIAPGVPALQAEGELRLVLKSGNFGGQDFYRDALSVLYAPLR